MTAPAPHASELVEVTRGGHGDAQVESRHAGHVVVVGPDGEIAASLGDPRRSTFVRSAAKPFQAMASLHAIAEADGQPLLTEPELAVGWASHRGEPQHLEAVGLLLARAGIGGQALTCPPATAEVTPGQSPSRLQHNCSGKHALFAVAARALGIGREEILDPDGPLQRRVLELLESVLGPLDAVVVDGCGAPAVAAPLVGLAHAYRRLLLDDRYEPLLRGAWARPTLVGGTGRLDSAILEANPGRAVAKVGAEGIYGLGWRGRDGGVWGLALKVEDGAERAASATLGAIARTVGLLGDGGWDAPPVLGGGIPVGQVRASEAVHDLAAALPRV